MADHQIWQMVPGSSLSPLLVQETGLNDYCWCWILLLHFEYTTLEDCTRIAVASLPLLEEDAESLNTPEV